MLGKLQFRVALLTISLVWLVLRIVYWNGYYTEDSPGYVTDAIWAALGQYHARDNVNGLNVGTYLPVAVPIRLFGKSEVALSLWPLTCSLLGMLSLAGLGAVLFGRWYGLLAAFLYATYPGDIFFSTVVMPDSLQAGWLSFSVFLVALASVRPAAEQRWILVAGGVAMGYCHLVRANDVLLVPVGLAAVAILSTSRRETARGILGGCLAYLSGWAVLILAEGLAYFWAANDFLLRLRVLSRHYGTPRSIAEAGLNTDPSTIPFSIFPPVMWWRSGGWGHLNQDQAYHGLIFVWALLALSAGFAALIASRERIGARPLAGLVLSAAWFCWPLAYHQFGSQSVTEFVPMHRLSRHLVVYAPGAMFAVAAGCFAIVEAARKWRPAGARRALAAAGAAILIMHLHFNRMGEDIAHGSYHRIKGTYSRIRDRLPGTARAIVADPGDLCFLDFWLNPLGDERVRMIAYANYSACDEIERGVVLTQSSPGWEGSRAPVIRETVERLPCLVDPPPAWRLLYDGYPEKVYEVESGRAR